MNSAAASPSDTKLRAWVEPPPWWRSVSPPAAVEIHSTADGGVTSERRRQSWIPSVPTLRCWPLPDLRQGAIFCAFAIPTTLCAGALGVGIYLNVLEHKKNDAYNHTWCKTNLPNLTWNDCISYLAYPIYADGYGGPVCDPGQDDAYMNSFAAVILKYLHYRLNFDLRGRFTPGKGARHFQDRAGHLVEMELSTLNRLIRTRLIWGMGHLRND